MADFVDIVNTIRRMPEELAAEMRQRMVDVPEDVERETLRWAKDNPEPQYPTWGEWLCEVGVSRISSYDGDKVIYSRTKKFYEPMDEKTAKKLGIKPTARK